MEPKICKKCGSEINQDWDFCGKCGHPVTEEKFTSEKSDVKTKNVSTVFLIIAIVMVVFASIILYKAYDVKNNYYSSDSNYSLNKNSYVGGDAYNYIINSGYFSGYMSMSGSLYVVSSIFVALYYLKKER